jgi:nucleoside-diphosphate-sugar epimerase
MSRYLVTGAMGCIGAWVLYHLHQQGHEVVSFDLSSERYRLDQLLSAEEQSAITFIQGDLTDSAQVQSVFEQERISHVIHLAALQVPMCKANPILGARVNVVGTTNVFEAARQTEIKHLAYASSIAVYGPPEDYTETVLPHDAPRLPRTLYGVYKVANEDMAKVYWQDHGISSTALRPYTVFGLGRDQGLTSEPTKAMRAAANGEDYHIGFGGNMQFHYASDVALQFIAAADHGLDGAYSFNMGTDPISVETVASLIMELAPGVTITVGDKTLPFPEGFDATELHRAFETVYETDLRQALKTTIEGFRA